MNAKQEFLEEIKKRNNLICAKIGVDKKDFGYKTKWNILKDNYTKKILMNFAIN